MKRIVLIVVIILITYFSAVVGGQIILGYYQRKATIASALSGDYEKAIEYYSKLIYWRPDNPAYYHHRGDAYYETGRYEEALHDYNKVVELDGENNLQLILSIALTLKQQGNLRMEENYLHKLLKMSEHDKEAEVELWAANYHLGQLAFKNKRYREAINFYNAAQATEATSLGVYHRANAYFALGKVDSARQDLKHSLPFVKVNFVRENPNSILAKCDTCAFPFGSKAFEQLTESKRKTVIEALSMFPENKQVRETANELKRVEEDSK